MQLKNTIVSVGQSFGRGIPNITLEDCQFFGRPNFSGEKNRFKEEKAQFTVLIPNDVADQLRELGYNVKTNIPTQEELREFPDRETISHLKVAVDPSSDVWVKMGDVPPQKLAQSTWGIVDKSRITEMDMELRGWHYNKDDEKDPDYPGPKYSARLVKIYITLEHNRLDEKYGNVG